MKNTLLTVILFLFLAAYPAYGNTSYTLTLNGITYTPKHDLHKINKSLYLSADDFTALTYSRITSENKQYVLDIKGHVIKFTANDRIAHVNGKVTVLTHMPLLINKQLYMPVSILNYIHFPYKQSEETLLLAFDAVVPYSKISDSYEDHLLMESKITNLTHSLKALLPAPLAANLLDEAKKNDDYISFIDNTDKDSLLELMRLNLIKGKNIQVAFREIDVISDSPKVSGLKYMPLSLKTDDNNLIAEFGEKTLTYNCIWAAYMPSDSRHKIDVSKSLDATLMRMLYEYFRDQYDLKDDLYFSPVVPIKNARTNSIAFRTYSDHITNQKLIYDVVVYKTIDHKQITYTVDFILHP